MICVLYTHARIVRMYVYVGTLGGHFRIEEFQLALYLPIQMHVLRTLSVMFRSFRLLG